MYKKTIMVLFVMLVVAPAMQAGTTTVVVFTAYDPYYGTGVNFVSEQPSNNSWVEVYDHNLSITVSNNLGEIMNVSFYWANNDSLIEKVEDVLNDTIAFANSSFNYTNYQNYSWYVTLNSTHYNNMSDIWNFTGEAYIWDVDRSADITLTDLTSIATHYKETGDAHWIRQDTTSNGIISLSDITYVASYYGESY